MKGIVSPVRNTVSHQEYTSGGIINFHGADTPQMVVLGDSHGLMWAAVLNEISKENQLSVSFYAADGASPFFKIPVQKSKGGSVFTSSERFIFDTNKLLYLADWKPDIVIISAKWSNVTNGKEAEDLISFLGDIGSKVLLLEQPPELFFGDKNAPRYLTFLNIQPKPETRQYLPRRDSHRYDEGLQLSRRLAENCSYCSLIPISDLFAEG